MKFQIFFLMLFLLSSCNTDRKTEGINRKENISTVSSPEIDNEENISEETISTDIFRKEKYRDTIAIDYLSNKKILELLKILPKETMGSWQWTQEERIKTVDFVAKNNYLIDSTEMYNNIEYVKPNTLGIQVVDGFWTLSIFELNTGKSIVISNDIVGDGNDINTFLYDGDGLEKIEFERLFGKGINNILEEQSEKCLSDLADVYLTFDYDFTDTNVVKIISWGIDKDQFNNCYKGNAIEFKLNKSKELFELEKIYWNEN